MNEKERALAERYRRLSFFFRYPAFIPKENVWFYNPMDIIRCTDCTDCTNRCFEI